jgi:HYR domain-containing protein
MKTRWTLLLIAGLGLMRPVAAEAQAIDLRPMVVTDLTGDLHIFQDLPYPCSNVDRTIPVVHGRIEIAPGDDDIEVGGQRLFMLTRASVSFAPFSVHRSCVGYDVTRNYTVVSVQLAGAASFLASPSGPNVYPVTIPKKDVLLHEASVVNGEVAGGEKHPKEDVTGVIDIAHGTVQLVVKVPTKVHVSPDVLYGDYHGTLTATLSGRIVFPDTDGDGVSNAKDNCRLVPNPDQAPVASPVILAPGDITLSSCFYRQLGLPTAADLCEGAGLTITNDAPTKLPLGTTVVTWKAEDIHGRYAKSQQHVTVVDTTPPGFLSVPPNVNLGNCGPASLGMPTGVDDCDTSVAFTNNAPATFLVGQTVVTWTASDVSGNHNTASQTVTVTDTVRPKASCTQAVSPPGYFRATASDACTASPTIRLGSFILQGGETFGLASSSVPGVRFLGYDLQRRRLFEAGPTENFITATDAAGNVKTATCVLSRLP